MTLALTGIDQTWTNDHFITYMVLTHEFYKAVQYKHLTTYGGPSSNHFIYKTGTNYSKF